MKVKEFHNETDCEIAIWLYVIISPRFNPAQFFYKNYKTNKK